MATQEKRLFVGGLFDGVEKDDLQERFGKFGSVTDIDVRKRLDDEGNPMKVFAYVNMKISDANFKKCLQLYNKTRWRGREVQIQVAKESFIDRLKRERQAAEQASENQQEPEVRESHEDVQKLKVKGAAPGTAIEGKQDWVVGKYGRPMPVVKIRRKDKQKVVKIDPSNFTHTIKKLEGGNQDVSQSVNDLSWFSEEDRDDRKSNDKRQKSQNDSSSSSDSSSESGDGSAKKRKRKVTVDTPNKKKTVLSNAPTPSSVEKRTKKDSSESSLSDSNDSKPKSKASKAPPSVPNKLLKDNAKKPSVGDNSNDFEVVSISAKVNGRHQGSDSDDSADTDELFSRKKSGNVPEKRKDAAKSPAIKSSRTDNFTEVKEKVNLKKPKLDLAKFDSGSECETQEPPKIVAKKSPGKKPTAALNESSKQPVPRKALTSEPKALSNAKKFDMMTQIEKFSIEAKEADPYDSSDSETPADILRRLFNKNRTPAKEMVGNQKEEKKELGAKKVDQWIKTQDAKNLDKKAAGLPVQNKAEDVKSKGSPLKAKLSSKETLKQSQTPSLNKNQTSTTNKGQISTPNKSETSSLNKILGGLAAKVTTDEFYSGHDVSFDRDAESAEEEEDLLDLVASGQIGKLKRMAKDIEQSGGQKQTTKQQTKQQSQVKEQKKKSEDVKKSSASEVSTEVASLEKPSDVAKKSNTADGTTGAETSKGKKKKEKKEDGEKTKKSFMNKDEKHAFCNEKRLESMKEKQKAQRTQKRLIQSALSSVDKREGSNKIVFDSDQEEDYSQSSLMDTAGVETKYLSKKMNNSVNNKKDSESSGGSSSDESSSEDGKSDLKKKKKQKSKKKVSKKTKRKGDSSESSSDSSSEEDETKSKSAKTKKTKESAKPKRKEDSETSSSSEDSSSEDEPKSVLKKSSNASTAKSKPESSESSSSSEDSSSEEESTTKSKKVKQPAKTKRKQELSEIGSSEDSSSEEESNAKSKKEEEAKKTKTKVQSLKDGSSSEESTTKSKKLKQLTKKKKQESTESSSINIDSSSDDDAPKSKKIKKPLKAQTKEESSSSSEKSSSSEDEETNLKSSKLKTKESVISKEEEDSSEGNEEGSSSSKEDEAETKTKNLKSGGLFESDSEAEEEDDEDAFRIRPEKEGRAGQKLMALQSRLGADSRFKIDESFVEGEEEEEDQVDEEENMETSDNDAAVPQEGVSDQEKQKSMSILAGIVGSTQLGKKDRRPIYRDLTKLQYDPTREGHEELEVNTEPKPNKKKEKKVEVKEPEKKDPVQELPEVSKDKYFSVTTSLKDVFTKDTGFSFNFAVEDEDSTKTTKQAANATATSKKIDPKDSSMSPWLQKQFNYDSSDEEEDGAKVAKETESTTAEKQKSEKKASKSGWARSSETFFFTESDARIKESLDFFCNEEDIQKIREEWTEQRPALVEAYRDKRKRAIRKTRQGKRPTPWQNNKTSRRNFHPAKRARKILHS